MRYMVVPLEVSQFGYVRVEIRQLIEEVAHVGEGGGSGSGGGESGEGGEGGEDA